MHVSVGYVARKWRHAPFVMFILNKFQCNRDHSPLYICTRATLVSTGISCRHVSVCLSKCSTKTAKHRIMQTMPHNSPGTHSFLTRKISAKFKRGHPQWRRQMQVGQLKNGDFRRDALSTQSGCKFITQTRLQLQLLSNSLVLLTTHITSHQCLIATISHLIQFS